MGILTGRAFGAARGPQEVEQGVKAQKAQQYGVNGADEQFGEQGVGIVQALVDGAADKGAHNGARQKGYGQLCRDVAQLFVHRGAHDGLGKNMEEVRAHGQNALDAHSHQGRSDDEAAARADAAGNQAGGQAHGNGGQKDGGGVECRSIGGLAAQHFMIFIGFGQTAGQDGHGQRQQNEQFFAVSEDGGRNLQIPFGIRL